MYIPQFSSLECGSSQFVGKIADGKIAKKFDNLAIHASVYIKFSLATFDQWNGEFFGVLADDKVVYQKSFFSTDPDRSSNVCAGSDSGAINVVAFEFEHIRDSISLIFVSTLEVGVDVASWGICGLEVHFNTCPIGQYLDNGVCVETCSLGSSTLIETRSCYYYNANNEQAPVEPAQTIVEVAQQDSKKQESEVSAEQIVPVVLTIPPVEEKELEEAGVRLTDFSNEKENEEIAQIIKEKDDLKSAKTKEEQQEQIEASEQEQENNEYFILEEEGRSQVKQEPVILVNVEPPQDNVDVVITLEEIPKELPVVQTLAIQNSSEEMNADESKNIFDDLSEEETNEANQQQSISTLDSPEIVLIAANPRRGPQALTIFKEIDEPEKTKGLQAQEEEASERAPFISIPLIPVPVVLVEPSVQAFTQEEEREGQAINSSPQISTLEVVIPVEEGHIESQEQNQDSIKLPVEEISNNNATLNVSDVELEIEEIMPIRPVSISQIGDSIPLISETEFLEPEADILVVMNSSNSSNQTSETVKGSDANVSIQELNATPSLSNQIEELQEVVQPSSKNYGIKSKSAAFIKASKTLHKQLPSQAAKKSRRTL